MTTLILSVIAFGATIAATTIMLLALREDEPKPSEEWRDLEDVDSV